MYFESVDLLFCFGIKQHIQPGVEHIDIAINVFTRGREHWAGVESPGNLCRCPAVFTGQFHHLVGLPIGDHDQRSIGRPQQAVRAWIGAF